MLSPKTRRNIAKVVPFGLIWLVFSVVYTLLEAGLIGSLNYYPSTGNPYNFGRTFFVSAITSLIVGLFIGTVEVLYLNKLFLQKSFVAKLGYKTLIYGGIIVVFLLILTTIYNAVELRTHVFDTRVQDNVWIFFTSYAFWSVEVYIAAIIGVSLFYTEVSDNLGQGVLTNFFTGRYHTPRVEERIFMFLDMKSSTTIAEKIGHVKYFEMLRMYFLDLSDPVINYSGEIYQYVGDEIVLSWKVNHGLHSNNCIECFFAMKAEIKSQADKYQAKFGVIPDFKAGLHIGKVTTGEIGALKKEIIFTGDVLNATSRIQGLCNTYKVDIIISDQLIQRLDLAPKFKAVALGESELRGRDEKLILFSIQ